MDDEIKIQAQVLSDEQCEFTVDRPVCGSRSIYFKDREAAESSPLAQKIFELEDVVGVLLSDNVVKVSTTGFPEWMPLAKHIGSIIRSQLQSDVAAVSEEAWAKLPSEEEICQKVQTLLDKELNPAISGHGGFVDLVRVKGNSVYLRLGGGCQGCGMANVTLRMGIERAIRDRIPEVGEILDVSDHRSGRNPYYASPAQ
jgi:Fe-S cluster biogenesis protein NfuA